MTAYLCGVLLQAHSHFAVFVAAVAVVAISFQFDALKGQLLYVILCWLNDELFKTRWQTRVHTLYGGFNIELSHIELNVFLLAFFFQVWNKCGFIDINKFIFRTFFHGFIKIRGHFLCLKFDEILLPIQSDFFPAFFSSMYKLHFFHVSLTRRIFINSSIFIWFLCIY